jgi:hypothetical protein
MLKPEMTIENVDALRSELHAAGYKTYVANIGVEGVRASNVGDSAADLFESLPTESLGQLDSLKE